MNTRAWTTALFIGLSAGCGLPLPQNGGQLMDSGNTDGGEGSTGVVESSSLGGSSSPSTDTGTTGDGDETSTTGGSTSEGDSTGEPPPLSVCDPQPQRVEHLLSIDQEVPVGGTQEWEASCSVATILPMDGYYSISLDCDDAPRVLEVADLGPIDLAPSDMVTLRVHLSLPWWTHTFIVLLRADEVIVAGMQADQLPEGTGDDYWPAAGFFDPLGVELIPDVCRPEPLPEEEEECENFICSPPCTQDQRQVLRFSDAGDSTDVYDRTTAQLGDLEIAVSAAEDHVQVLCVDTAGAWYEFVAMRTL